MPNDGAGAGTGAAGSAGAAASGANPQWFDTFAPELKGYVENKGFKDPAAVVESYRNLEKIHSAGPERLLKLPENLNDDKALSEIYTKLGRPEKPEGYDAKLPEGVDVNFKKWAVDTIHSLGLTKKQGDAFFAKWSEHATKLLDDSKKTHETSVQQQVEKLKQDWGAAYEQNNQTVADFQAAAGIDDKMMAKLDSALGMDESSKLIHNIIQKFGIKLGEGSFRGGDGSTGNFRILSPEAAGAKLSELKTDSEWLNRYLSGGKAEIAEVERLTRWQNSIR
jgi:hypothetical protein